MRLDGIRLGSGPDALERLGLTTTQGRANVGGVTLESVPGAGILGIDLAGAPRDTPLALVDVTPAPPAAHPLGATAVDHVVVLCGDVRAAIEALGTTPRRLDERDGRTYGFVVVETALLEFVGPSEPEDRAPRLWGLALTVSDLDAAVALLGDACGRPKDAIQPGRRIATVRHDQLELRVPTVLLSPRPGRSTTAA